MIDESWEAKNNTYSGFKDMSNQNQTKKKKKKEHFIMSKHTNAAGTVSFVNKAK